MLIPGVKSPDLNRLIALELDQDLFPQAFVHGLVGAGVAVVALLVGIHARLQRQAGIFHELDRLACDERVDEITPRFLLGKLKGKVPVRELPLARLLKAKLDEILHFAVLFVHFSLPFIIGESTAHAIPYEFAGKITLVVNTKEQLRILNMIQDGRITAGEGMKLLEALEDEPDSEVTNSTAKPAVRWLLVRITDLATGLPKVNIKLPVGVVQARIKTGARFSIGNAHVDTSEITRAIAKGKTGQIVNLRDTEDGEHVQIYLE